MVGLFAGAQGTSEVYRDEASAHAKLFFSSCFRQLVGLCEQSENVAIVSAKSCFTVATHYMCVVVSDMGRKCCGKVLFQACGTESHHPLDEGHVGKCTRLLGNLSAKVDLSPEYS